MVKNIDTLSESFKALENCLIEYNTLTNSLLSLDYEDADETDEVLLKRGNVISMINETRNEITLFINSQESADAAGIKKMISGQIPVSSYSLSNAEKLLNEKIIDVRSLQIEILQKDEQIALKMKAKRDEIHSALSDLQKDKKKINFYNKVSVREKGQDYDTSN